MQVQDVMRKGAVFCPPDLSLAAAANLLVQNGCGCLPVVGEGGNVIGMVTDRDICIALAKRSERPSQIPVWEAMQRKLFTCSPGDNIHCALKTMRRQKIRRLPVVDRNGVLQGILCLDDIVQRAQSSTGKDELSFEDVVLAWQTIAKQDSPGTARNAAAA